MKRRVLLARVGTVAVAGAFAGCIDEAGSDGNGGDSGSGANGDGDGDEEPADDEDEGENETDENEDDTDDRTNSSDDDDDNDDEGTETDPVTDTTITTLEAECGSTSEATIEFDLDLEGETGTATITGFVRAPNPCHEAVVVGTVAENEMVTVTVGVESDGEDVCIECTGHVEYEATITFGEQLPDVLAVDHDSLEETTAVTRRELDGE